MLLISKGIAFYSLFKVIWVEIPITICFNQLNIITQSIMNTKYLLNDILK